MSETKRAFISPGRIVLALIVLAVIVSLDRYKERARRYTPPCRTEANQVMAHSRLDLERYLECRRAGDDVAMRRMRQADHIRDLPARHTVDSAPRFAGDGLLTVRLRGLAKDVYVEESAISCTGP